MSINANDLVNIAGTAQLLGATGHKVNVVVLKLDGTVSEIVGVQIVDVYETEKGTLEKCLQVQFKEGDKNDY